MYDSTYVPAELIVDNRSASISVVLVLKVIVPADVSTIKPLCPLQAVKAVVDASSSKVTLDTPDEVTSQVQFCPVSK